jgi:hypothetical protein
MKAKKVFEAQNFERGQNPKKTLDLGGIDLFKEVSKRLETLKERKEEIEIEENKNWEMFLEETLVGKKITAKMTSMPAWKVNKEGGIGEKVGTREIKDFTITVQDIQSESIESFRDMRASIIVADTDNKIYQLHLNDKIYFE